MKKETLEEASENYLNKCVKEVRYTGYSEEEVLKVFEQFDMNLPFDYKFLVKESLQQFKKNKMKQTAVEWWNSLQPEEQQELFEKYYPDNNFGALAADENDINNLYEKEIIYEFTVTDTNNIKTKNFVPCQDELEAIRIKELTLKGNGVASVEFKKK